MDHKISTKQKEIILEESYTEGCIISKLAEKNKISKATIYRWRSEREEEAKEEIMKKKGKANFVEVSVKKEVANQLKKVELVYEEFGIEIVGKISSGKIAPIMGILEE
jgi:transposase-like protein